HDLGKMARWQAVAGTDATHIRLRQLFAGGDIGDGVERAAEDDRRLFALRWAIFDTAACEISLAAGLDQGFELIWQTGEARIRGRGLARVDDVFLDNARADADSDRRRQGLDSMVGI